jgi:hypothetical protein
MLFQSSLRRELSRSFGATLIVLVTVVMTMTLIRTLGQASRGSFNPSDVMLVMGYTVLAYMPTLLTMSLFIAIIATLSRMYRDSEMVIWFCSGKGLSALLAPLMRFSWPVFGVVAALAMLVLPWTNQRIDDLKTQYEKRSDIERIEPGQFQESSNGERVFFVEKNTTAQQSGSNVFIATTERGKETVTSARSGRVDVLPQGQFLMLNNGQRLEVVVGTTDLKISEFEEYGAQISQEVPWHLQLCAREHLAHGGPGQEHDPVPAGRVVVATGLDTCRSEFCHHRGGGFQRESARQQERQSGVCAVYLCGVFQFAQPGAKLDSRRQDDFCRFHAGLAWRHFCSGQPLVGQRTQQFALERYRQAKSTPRDT